MEQQVYDRMAADEDTHWWFLARRHIIQVALSQHLELADPARLLEAGCGSGGNLSMLASFGAVSAFEPNPRARELARQRGQYDIREGSLPERIPFPEGSFDIVTALDVIEHLEDARTSLQALWNQLRPGGWLLLTVPAYQFLWSSHDIVHHHKQRYNKHMLLHLVRAVGFLPVHFTYFNTFLFPLGLVTRLAQKCPRLKGANDSLLPPRFINNLLKTIFGLERFLVGRIPFPFGLSLLMIARKPN